MPKTWTSIRNGSTTGRPNSKLKIQLISADNDLFRLCEETLAEFHGQEFQFSAAGGEDPACDLCIWDYAPDRTLPQSADWTTSKHLFLVERKDISEFRRIAPSPGAAIVLKPVTRASLAAFLAHAFSNHGTSQIAEHSIRADRDELLQYLIEANLKLQEYDHDRTNFVARGIHDFRAPLTAISEYCGLLLSEALGPLSAEQREVLGRMQHSSKRLWRMASAMSQLSLGLQMKARPEMQRHDLQDCLSQALHEITPSAEAKQISITVDMEPEFRSVHCDQSHMEQLFINILDNACKFTPRYGEIEIRGYGHFWDRRKAVSSVAERGERRRHQSQAPNCYRLDIRNSGNPIPTQRLQTIFEEYTSYSGGEDRSGGGLGLALCKMFALQHEGMIWAENTEEGPQFSLVIPAHAHPAVETADPEQPSASRPVNVVEVL
jgi:signal transduction histidine kinase